MKACSCLSVFVVGISSSFFIAPNSIFAQVLSTNAAVVADDSPIGTQVRVDSQNQKFTITNGSVQNDQLFHSFEEFSPDIWSAVFDLTDEAYAGSANNVSAIFSRVTGSSASVIDGWLRVQGGNSPDLFLINPNGIFFGPNARLDIGGSFLASTANSIIFGNGSEFSAADPQSDPLLEVNTPIGLQYGTLQPRGISVAGRLEVGPSESLVLAGGDVQLGSSNGPRTLLDAQGGRIELGGLSEPGIIYFDEQLQLAFAESSVRADVNLTDSSLFAKEGGNISIQSRNSTFNHSSLNVSISDVGSPTSSITIDGQGDISFSKTGILSSSVGTQVHVLIRGDRVTLLQGSINSTAPFRSGTGGIFNFETNRLDLAEGASIRSDATGSGQAGSISLRPYGNGQTLTIVLQNGANIAATTSGSGAGGDISFSAPEEIRLTGNGSVSVETSGPGNAGDISFSAKTLTSEDGVRVSAAATAEAAATAQGGDILVDASQVNLNGNANSGLFVETRGNASAGAITFQPRGNGQSVAIYFQENAQISAATRASGLGGSITVNAPESIVIHGPGSISAGSQGAGQGGDVVFDTRELQILNGSRVSTSTETGTAGNIRINTQSNPAAFVRLSDPGSEVTAEATGDDGIAGGVEINARQLWVQNGASISTSSTSGQSGDIALRGLETLEVVNGGILAITESGTAGDLTINAEGAAADRIYISGLLLDEQGQPVVYPVVDIGERQLGSGLYVAAIGGGRAGNLTVRARSITLDRGALGAETARPSDEPGANITLLEVERLLLDNGGLISANALGEANGGNITIDAADGFVIAAPGSDSDVVARAVEGRGGRIDITAQGIYGLEVGEAVPGNRTNDIDASSEFGENGTVTINEIAPEPKDINLPETVLVTENQVDQRCGTDAAQLLNSFFITGRGGIPPSPREIVEGESGALVDLRIVSDESTGVANPSEFQMPEVDSQIREPIMEAQSWYRNSDGAVVLTAQTPMPLARTFMPAACN